MADSAAPISYTSNPFLLFVKDLGLFVANIFTSGGILSIVRPLAPTPSGSLDELYPSRQNIWAILLHAFLVVVQLVFLVSLAPFAIGIPLPILYFLYVVGFVVGNQYFTILLNGRRKKGLFKSNDRYTEGRKLDEHERWIFINGVAVGNHWLQTNLDKLALTFRRPIYGIHNQTRGIIFDVIESIIQRDFGYATLDIRQAYSAMIEILSDKDIHKVVAILHSQGAIEGGLVLDWLYATVSPDQLAKLEIYTFGNAANHWNAPSSKVTTNGAESIGDTDESMGSSSRREVEQQRTPGSVRENATRTVRHIEHYANLHDYVARGGILHFRPDPAQPPGASVENQVDPNRFVGRLFKRNASGHLMNQHYLNNFFPVDTTDPATGKVVENNDYMDSLVDMNVFERWDTVQVPASEQESTNGTKIKTFSRLWKYRNGGRPDDSNADQE
ncbi:hypothetical protein LTR84_012740 [Exophiala bonariae]|uniref:Uncharacterized protein n=1 Tax=Exophiala bonariae TaxID=1690606 RepID=A0AAV9NIK4_9EURO|nr:hypothetical protein LTR84_012740 [Exophiala bonariae]